MTRQEFIDNVTCMSDLIEFCADVDCDLLCDVYDSEGRDDYINQNLLYDWARELDWEDVRNILDDIPTGYDYYYYDGVWTGISEWSDFQEWKQQVLEWCDECDVFSDDEEELEDDNDGFPVDEEPEEQVELASTISELLQAGYDSVQVELLRIKATSSATPPGLPFRPLPD